MWPSLKTILNNIYKRHTYTIAITNHGNIKITPNTVNIK